MKDCFNQMMVKIITYPIIWLLTVHTVYTIWYQNNDKKVNNTTMIISFWTKLLLCQQPTSMRHLRFIKISHILLHYSPSAYIEISSALLCRSCYWMMRWHLVLISRSHYVINAQCWAIYILYLCPDCLSFLYINNLLYYDNLPYVKPYCL